MKTPDFLPLPEGWTVTQFPCTLEVCNKEGKTVHAIPVPYDPVPFVDLWNLAVSGALDPCLRNPDLPKDGGHALNGLQLHYKKA